MITCLQQIASYLMYYDIISCTIDPPVQYYRVTERRRPISTTRLCRRNYVVITVTDVLFKLGRSTGCHTKVIVYGVSPLFT